jgi:hypothetical protein
MEAITMKRPKTIALTYDKANPLAKKTLNYVLSLGVFQIKEDDGDSREEIIANLKGAAQSLRLIKEGKPETRPLQEFLDEV